MAQNDSGNAVCGCNVGYALNFNVNVLFCIHYGVKKAFKKWEKIVLQS